MAKVLAVVMSDLHFGEEASVVHYGQKYKQGKQPLVNRIVELTRVAQPGGSIPFLILAGDTVDFSLATVQDAIADFRLFLEDVHECFDSFVYTPGNHDHHIWRTLQEQIFVVNRIHENREIGTFPQEQIGTIKKGRISLDGVAPEKQLGAKTFLNDLLPPAARCKQFAVTYPNLFLEFPNAERNMLITHGHFFEKVWTFTSDMLRRSLALEGMNYEVLERINSPITEFGWYGLGQAGELSNFTERLYKEVKNSEAQALDRLLEDLKRYIDDVWKFTPARKEGFLSSVRNYLSRLGADVKEKVSDEALEVAIGLVKSLVLSQLEEKGPQTPGSPLRHCDDILENPERKARIGRYISHSTAQPYGFTPRQIVFGHTHRPIKDGDFEIAVGGETLKMKAYNPGGWLVDSKDANHIIKARPMPLLVYDDGRVKGVDFPWPMDAQSIANKSEAEIRDAIRMGDF